MTYDDILFFIIIYTVGLGVLIFLTGTVFQAAAETDAAGRRTASVVISILWAWAIFANGYALLAGDGILWLVASLVVPLVLGFAATFLDPVIRLLRSISITRLVIVQVYRIAGSVFLISYFVTGSYMSREFAVNAGWGDVLTGILAIPAALATKRKIPFWPAIVTVWCLIGIGDLILAPVTAQLHGGVRSNDFPLNTIPIFFGPPLGILLHLIVLRAMWIQRQSQVSVQRPDASHQQGS